ncbi:hypothetical protein HFV04_008605 [Pseudomonas sp. BIGb0427]|uniref:hypothetical protein n=1 Tax=unclassified Pseudomonas TaxID=196821 RepID=UPI0018A74675|nr:MULTISPECIES: hypothetical protein [unclassified Pseudomonas]QPG64816.1 hypothetical protein HFV04_008605 [Pseudomonas sp. BIGb0427]UVM67253.1 hypothetical protein LOY34_01605 [Pseudomonas sp. B21-009]
MRTFSRHYLGAVLACFILPASANSYGQALAIYTSPAPLDITGKQNAHWNGVDRISTGNIAVDKPSLVSGEPNARGFGLRLSSCTLQKSDDFVLLPMLWRTTLCEQCVSMYDGASGSPDLSRPSEINAGLITGLSFGSGCAPAFTGQHYGLAVERLFRCDQGERPDTVLEGLNLLPGFTVEQQPSLAFLPVDKKIATPEDDDTKLSLWDYQFVIDVPIYRYKPKGNAL